MSKRSFHPGIIALLLLLFATAFGATACGNVNMSGEPKIVAEAEIRPANTLPPPTTAPENTPAAESTPDTGTTPQAEPTAAPADEPVDALPGVDILETSGVDLASADYGLGQELYLDECATCHGAQDGTGPSLGGMVERAAQRVPGLSAEEYLLASIVDPPAYLVAGFQDVMPKNYAERFSPHELNSIVKFIIDFRPPGMASAAEDGNPTPGPAAVSGDPADTLEVTGRLIQGTAGSDPIAPGLAMELYALDSNNQISGPYTTTSGEDGRFTFEGVVRAAGTTYLIQVRYADVPQGAKIAAIHGTERVLNRDITLYERTTDRGSIIVTWAQMLVNYAPINEFGLEVWMRVELANRGDRIVTTDEVAAVNPAFMVSAVLELPVGSFGIQPIETGSSQRYMVEEIDGIPVVKDTWPLRPGQTHTINLAYYLPYTNGAVLDQAFGFPVMDAAVLLPNDTVTLESDQLETDGEWRYRVTHDGTQVVELEPDERIDPENDFTLVKSYDLKRPLTANGRLVFALDGRPTRTINIVTPLGAAQNDDADLLPLALFTVGFGVILLAGILWWRQRGTAAAPPALAADQWRAPDGSSGKTGLLAAIVALDDAYSAGAIDAATYERRREILAERLLPYLAEPADGDDDQ